MADFDRENTNRSDLNMLDRSDIEIWLLAQLIIKRLIASKGDMLLKKSYLAIMIFNIGTIKNKKIVTISFVYEKKSTLSVIGQQTLKINYAP